MSIQYDDRRQHRHQRAKNALLAGGLPSVAKAMDTAQEAPTPTSTVAEANRKPVSPSDLSVQLHEDLEFSKNEVRELAGILSPPVRANKATNQIAFLDTSLLDYELMLSEIGIETEFVILDPNRNCISQVASALENRSSVTSLYVISQKVPGVLKFGPAHQVLKAGKGEYAREMASIATALDEVAEVFVFGCELNTGKST